jgi:AsmA protein
VTAATGFKRLGFTVVALIVCGTGALASMSLLISDERVRESAKAEIRNVTGLDLTLRGSSTISLFPTGSVSFSDVVLGEDGAREPALSADRLTARLRLLPLFIGRIEIADVALDRPRINMTFGAEGRSNWSGLMASLARALGPKANRADQEASFSEIRVRGGTITLTDSVHGVSETLSDADLALAWPSISKSFAATGRVVWRGEPVDASISLSDFPSALAGERSGLKVRLSGPLLKLAFEGAMSLRPTLKVDGTLSADSTSLRDTLRWVGQKPLPGGGFGRFALKAKTSVASGTIALSSVNVELDGNSAEGALTFATDGRQTLQGTLAADDLDLTPYVSTVRLVTANDRDWNELPIVLDGLTGIDLDLRLSAAKIAIARAKLGRTAVTVNLRGGKLTVTVGESQAFGGLIRGSLTLGATDIGADFKSQLQFTDVDLEGALGEIFNIRRVEGRGNLALAVEASGGSILALTQSMNGSASLTGREGALLRINVEQILARIMRRPIGGPGDMRTGKTPFDKLICNLKIVQGKANIEEARLEGPKVRIVLDGSSAIPTRDLDLRGTASLFVTRANDTPPVFDLRFAVTGSWDEPIPLLDTQSLIERSPSAVPLLDAIKKRNSRETVPEVIDRITGGASGSPPPAAAPPTAEPATTAPSQNQ